MKTLLFTLLLSFLDVFAASGQITGNVTASSGVPLPGANVYLLNTLDGTSTDASGKFAFSSGETGDHVLVISAIGYSTKEIPLTLSNQPLQLEIKLDEEATKLDEVVITAGSMEANSDRDVAILKPMDIYTNAGAAGDIVGAIQTLPGTQRVAEQTGLFVRGGDASESTVIIDGMTVQNAFYSNVPGVAQRSRFTPFQFKGMAFSSGGYSVRYGQALSSILELNTVDLAEKSTINANVNMAGAALSGVKRWTNASSEVTAYYNNLTPFYSLAHTNFDFYNVPSGGGASAKLVSQTKGGGLFKTFLKHDQYSSGTKLPDPYTPGNDIRFGLRNSNSYFNSSYRLIKNKNLFYTAASASKNDDDINYGPTPSENKDWRIQWRGEDSYFATNDVSLLIGAEVQRYHYSQKYDTLSFAFDESLVAAYAEVEWKPSNQFAIKTGARYEHSHLLTHQSVAPRVSMAFKTAVHSQVSLASGIFYQNPDKKYLLPGYRPGFQQAVHYMINYQWIKDDRSFRIEGYYKSYNELVRELQGTYNPNPYRFVFSPVDNSGNGYAQGIDVFWRDKKLIKNFDYWIAYSFVDTKRLYANLPQKATPDFVSNHNLNVTTKYFVESIQLNVGVTYSYSSGRPYYNPAETNFLGSHAPDYHNVAMNLSYLTTLGKWFTVLYASVDNVMNRENILGYRYSIDGQQRYPIVPPMYLSFFVGANISLTSFSKSEL